MPTYVALMRGINVGGHRSVRMADLHAHFAACGALDVRTYIQSGNVVFRHGASDGCELRTTLETRFAESLGFSVTTLVRTVDEFRAIAAANPYDTALPDLGNRMYVCFFERAPSDSAVASIRPLVTQTEQLVVRGAAGYAYYAQGLGRAKLSSSVIERKLGLVTLRNWNTVTAVLALANA